MKERLDHRPWQVRLYCWVFHFVGHHLQIRERADGTALWRDEPRRDGDRLYQYCAKCKCKLNW